MSDIETLIEFAEHNADDWNWPIGIVDGSKAELAALRARVAAMEKACEAGDALIEKHRTLVEYDGSLHCCWCRETSDSMTQKHRGDCDVYRAAREASR